jgi:hypothetical protein
LDRSRNLDQAERDPAVNHRWRGARMPGGYRAGLASIRICTDSEINANVKPERLSVAVKDIR